MDKCAGCSARPTGIEGHRDLFTHRMAGTQMQFKCRACNLLWIRGDTGEGGFEWAMSSGEFFGAGTPGWHQPER
jgi:hypothetical protein